MNANEKQSAAGTYVQLVAEEASFLNARRGGNIRPLLLAGTIFASMAAYPAFQCEVEVPAGDVGVSRTAKVTYFNDGTAAIAAPYVRIEAGDNAYVRFSESDAWSKSVEFLATSDQSPASSLRAGETVEIPVFVYTATQEAQLTLSYTQSSTETFPWSSIGSSLKPSYVADSAWTFAFATLKSRFGTTWNSYLSRLRANADYLAENGRPVRRLDRLLQIEINHALGVDAVLPVLASVTDAARSARGMGLSFTRSYSSAMYGRFTSGILGFGWTDNLSTCADLTDSQTLVFRVPGGGSYSFTKATGSWQPEDSRDKTILTESSNAYTLTYQSGTVQTFAKSNMRTSSIADNCGNTLTFTWSGTTLQKITHTDGQTLTFSYSDGRLYSVTDDCGRQTTYTYSNSLLTRVTASDGLVTSYEYRPADGTAAACALSRIVYPDGTTREFSYDSSSGLVTAISSNGGKETTTISREGGVITLTGPDGAETTVKTGVSGETLETTDALGGTSTKGYTEDGLLKSVVSPSGLNGRIEHDALGRVSQSVSAAGTATAFTYEETFGNLKMVMDAKNHAITYGYDAKGRGTSVAFADGSASKLEYNSRGDVVKSTNRRGQTVSYTYDSQGRVTKKAWSNGRTFTYAYDPHGNVTTATDSETGAVTMQYDSADRLIRIEYPTGRGFTFVYDACGRLASRTMLGGSPSSATEVYAYDALGRLASVSDGDGNAYLQNTYDETTGRLTRQVNGNGTSVSYLYDKLGRVVSIEHCGSDGKIVESLQYCYDADGRCVRASSLLGEERYGYDNDGQLISARYPDSPSEAFAYDAVGNRTTANGATYTVNNLNQYTAVSGGSQSSATAITYDNDGNMTSLTDENGTTTYTYDTLNRLVAVKNPAKGIDWSCQYDVFGNRVSVTDNGVTTERTYLQGSLPSVAAEYVNGELTERHIVVGAVRIADLTTNNSALITKYYHADLIGSTRLITDGNGTIIDRRAYKAFGETRMGGSPSSATASAGYVGTLGVETDSTGLLFMRNRYYSPTLGRFIQMDPIGLGGEDVNVYAYVKNDAIIHVDPYGFQRENLTTAAGNFLMNDIIKGDAVDYLAEYGGASASVAYLKFNPSADVANVANIVKGFDYAGDAINALGVGEKFGTLGAAAVVGIEKGRMEGWQQGVIGANDVLLSSDATRSLASIGMLCGELVAKGVITISKLLKPEASTVVDSGISGGSGSIYPDKIDDFGLVDGSFKEVTVSGSFTILFEWEFTINPGLDYPHPFAGFGFSVDGIAQGLSGTFEMEENGVRRLSDGATVTGEGTHTLQWGVVFLTSLPVGCSVRNIRIVRSTAVGKSAATGTPGDQTSIMDDLSVKTVSTKSGATLVHKKLTQKKNVQSPKTAARALLSLTGNNTTSPRLYCYERYAAVKGLAYRFALSADEDASISVSGLPSGFSFSDGVISGTASAAGTTTMTITANGSAGTTTKDVQFDVIEAPEDFQPIISLLSHPDLRPCVASGWSAPLVVSTSSNSTYGATSFLDTESLYVSWLVECGNVNVEEAFYTCLYVDDVLKYYWFDEGLPRDYYRWNIGCSLGALSAGTHTVRIVTDATGAVAESNESNNSYETTITVVRDWFPNLSVPSLSASRTSIAVSDSVTVHWRVESNGDDAADKSKIAFLTYKYDAKLGESTLIKTEWLDCLPLAAGGSQEFKKTITGKSLGEGTYSFVVVADGDESIVEFDETDNIGVVAIAVAADIGTSSKSSVDWQFYKMKGEADSFFLCASSDMKKKVTTFNVGQPIYMRCCWCNAKKGAVSGNAMRARVMLNGDPGIYAERSYFEKNTHYYFTDKTPDFLQNLPAGDYTLTAVLDSEDAWWETDEKNNVKTISFTVVGTPKIFCETSYTCALNEPVSWPVTIDGKATVAGLPSGLKYSGGVITGKATKAGTYTVNISTKNEAGTATKSITIQVEDPGFIVSCSVQPNGSSAASNVASGGTVEMYAGVNQVITLSSVPGKKDVANADATVTVKGLPAGLKLSGGTITGVPTKAGTYAVNVTFKNKLSWTSSFMLNIIVHSLPDWAQGTFTGMDADYAVQEYGQATLTVSSAGKVSGKVSLCGTNWTFSAASYDSAILYESGAPAEFRIKADMKAGKAVFPVELSVFAINPPETGGSPLQNARVYGKVQYDANYAELVLWRTIWKDKESAAAAKAEIAKWEGVYTMSMEANGGFIETALPGGYLSLTVGKDGNVKASGKLADGTGVSTTSPLLYDEVANSYFVYLYAAPSAYKGGAFAAAVGFEAEDNAAAAGRPLYRLVPVLFVPLWTSHNPEATGQYGAGFSRGLSFTGAYYNKLAKLNDYYESLRLSLNGAPGLAYTYKETYLDGNNKKATDSSVMMADAVDTLSQDGMTATVNEKGALVVAKATKPVQDKETKEWFYNGANDGALTLSFAQATGIFTGSYTFWYDYTSAYDKTKDKNNETLAHTSKKVNFEGILVQGEESLRGFYLWDASSSYDDPKTGKPKTYKYKESYSVILTEP